MGSQLNPYLALRGNAREALEFYQSVFGGDLTINTYAEFATEGPQADLVMHGHLETPQGYHLMAADVSGEGAPNGDPGNITITVSGDDPQTS